MFPAVVDLAFERFQQRGDAKSLAIVFDRTAAELLNLARHLASSEADAEDLVQATFVTAIEAAKGHERGRPVLPWLCGILANQARAARRKSKRAVDATRLRSDVVDAHEVAEANELRGELRAAIDRLPEAYRPVLRLVLEHGLAAHEIAAALERPAGTVRAQLSRGLEQLRRALPRGLAGGAAIAFAVGSGRGMATVRAQVLGKCSGTSTGVLAALGLGGLFVLQHKLAAMAAVVVALALGLWALADRPDATAVAASGAKDVRPAVANAPNEVEASGAQRTVVPVADAATAASAKAKDAAAATTGTLIVQVVDGKNAPVEGVGVAVRSMRSAAVQSSAVEFLRTDRSGQVAFTELAPGSWMIDVDRANPEGGDVRAGEVERHMVRLADGIAVDGEVVDADDRPVAGARVQVLGSRLAAPQVAIADTSGRFHAAHLLTGLALQACAKGHAPSAAEQIVGRDGERRAMRLQLGRGGLRLEGRVLDDRGAPVADAEVALMPAAAATVTPAALAGKGPRASWLRCDRDGRFVCDEVGPGEWLVVAQAGDGGSAPSWRRVDVQRDGGSIELRLVRGAEVTGTVRKGGQPVASAMMLAWFGESAAELGYLANLLGIRQTTTDANGEYRLSGLLPGNVFLRAMGTASTLAEQHLELAAGARERWDVDVATDRGLRIAVRPAELGSRHALWAFIATQGAPDGTPPAMVLLQNAAGAEESSGPRTGPVDVTIASAHGGDVVQLAVRRGIAASEREVVFELSPAELPTRTIRGRLVDAQLAPRGNVPLVLTRTDGNGLVVHVATTTAADGAFALGPVPAGSYRLVERGAGGVSMVATATVTADRDEDLGNVQVQR